MTPDDLPHQVTFNWARCPLNCSGQRGACDLQGFCQCEPGFWGLDCGLTMRRDLGSGPVRAVAWRQWEASHALPPPPPQQPPPRPRIFVYDLPVRWRVGPQLLAELDYGLLERLLLSPHRCVPLIATDYGARSRPTRSAPSLSPQGSGSDACRLLLGSGPQFAAGAQTCAREGQLAVLEPNCAAGARAGQRTRPSHTHPSRRESRWRH